MMLAEVSNATHRRESERVNQRKITQRDSSGEVAEHLTAETTGNTVLFVLANDYWMTRNPVNT